jgi:hypothetical protein
MRLQRSVRSGSIARDESQSVAPAPAPIAPPAPPAPPGRMRSLAKIASRGLRRAFELFPWTPLGALLTAGAYLAIEWMARAQLDLVWLVIGYVGLGLALLGPLAVLLSAAWFRWRSPQRQPGEALTLETGTPTDTGFRLASPWYLPLIQLRWEWLVPGEVRVEVRRERGALLERVVAGERGCFEHVERRLRISDPFGLSRVLLRTSQPRAIDVLPRLGGLRFLPSLHALASGDAVPHPLGVEEGDRLELRRYTPGDSARFIHWKVLARSQKLMVRTPERALNYARRTAAFLVAGMDDDPTAAVARLAIERNLLGLDWVFGTDQDLAGTRRVGEALTALMRSTAARDRAGEGLSAFVQRIERDGPVSVIVFAPSRPGPWLDRLALVARRRKLRVVIGTDGVHEQERRPRFARWLAGALTVAQRPSGTPARDLERVLRTLGLLGAEVIVLDRGSGRQLGRHDRRAMLGLAGEPAWGAS